LPRKAFARKPEKQRGWNLFAGLPYRFDTLHAKISYAPRPLHQAGCFSRFLPKLFCWRKKILSVERTNLIGNEMKSGQRPVRKAGRGVWPAAWKLFSDLIFLVTFCIKTKSNSPRGN
jgi:hypothetical protein